MRIWVKRLIAIGIGSAAGYAYYSFVGCSSGACPITSNPYISTIYGAVLGFLLINGNRAKAPGER